VEITAAIDAGDAARLAAVRLQLAEVLNQCEVAGAHIQRATDQFKNPQIRSRAERRAAGAIGGTIRTVRRIFVRTLRKVLPSQVHGGWPASSEPMASMVAASTSTAASMVASPASIPARSVSVIVVERRVARASNCARPEIVVSGDLRSCRS
jgi:hypothetical protein